MNCGRVSNLLSAYIDRELTGAEILQLRSHLSDCDACRGEYEALCQTKMMLGSLRGMEPGHDFLAGAMRRIEASGAMMPGPRRRASSSPGRRFAVFPPLGRPSVAARPEGRGMQRLPVPALLRMAPWPRIMIGFTTAALVAALISTSVVLRKPRHSDALMATSPVPMLQGQDPLSLPSNSEWGAGTFVERSAPQTRLPGSPVPLQWMTISLQRESSQSFR